MPSALGLIHFLSLLVLAAGLASCGVEQVGPVDIDVVGAEAAPFEAGPRLSAAGQLVRAATAEGIVALDDQGRVIPAMADRWIVTEDGLSYIFRLREGTWPDGAEITGETAATALRDSLRALAGTALGRDLGAIGEVKAMAGRVVEIRLDRPSPDLLQLLAQPELGLFHKGKGGGPMELKKDGVQALLVPIPPERLGLPKNDESSAKLRQVSLHAVPAAVALKRFDDGTVDVVLGGRFENFPQAEAVVGLSRRLLRIDPVAGLFGLQVVTAQGPLAEAEFREALALAVDRDALQGALASGAWAPTTRIVGGGNAPASSPPAERWAGLSRDQRIAEAGARVARWKGRHGGVPALSVGLPEGPGADLLFQRLGADFGAIGVPLRRVAAGGDLQLVDMVARYSRPEWFLNQFACALQRGQCSADADARLEAALAEPDSQKRAVLLGSAEAVLTAANVYIPLGSPVRWSLARDRVSGFSVNPAGFHPLGPLAAVAP